ncbi:MAG TPA: type II toxin-antitoxin system VapB family antitoxin [Solirubrobacterales bacterium]|jgi:hypothetical protein|nr:type II toxin-antitoxin system VapB family antitoxin [Solirubrobacterales bacterium]
MALNFEDEEIERLAAEAAALAGESVADAVRRALRERLDRLERESVGKVARAGVRITPAKRPRPAHSPPPRNTGKSASAFVLEEREDER